MFRSKIQLRKPYAQSETKRNANYAWIQHFLYYLSPQGIAGFVLAKGSLTSKDDIQKIAQTYHEWRKAKGKYQDIKGFCNSASIERVKELDYVLTPGRYVGLPDEEDDFDFKERFTSLKAEFEAQLKEDVRLNKVILENLAKVQI